MKSLLSILALIASILSVVLAILPMEKIAIIPAIVAFVLALITMFLSKDGNKKLIKFVLLVTVIAFAIIGYKALFAGEAEVKVDENFIEKSQQSEEKALEELEDIEELDIFEESDSIN